MSPTTAELSRREARWLAIEAQGLGRPRRRRAAGASAAEVERTVGQVGALQLDAINVVERTQYLVLFSRLGAFDKDVLHRLTGPGGALWEYWGHAASLLPVADEPLLRWRKAIGGTYVAGPKVRARREAWQAAQASYLEAVLAEVRDRGPLTAGQLSDPRPRAGEWWGRRSHGRQALEWLFGTGQVAAWRTPAFERVYDLPERVVPAEVRAVPTPAPEEAHRALLRKAAIASGVGTLGDLADYYKIPLRWAKPRVDELVEDGQLVRVAVEGWDEPGYTPAGVRPRRPSRSHATLLSPFDSLIWTRDRVRRLYDFDYRIEVYVPGPKRVHGYYVLPVLIGDELVGRLDLKADRRASVLRVAAAHVESDVDLPAVAEATATELGALRRWLGLTDLSVDGRGPLARALR